MNRLVIVGNGFDLAHGLPTSYRDFIDDFWRDVISEYDGRKIWDFDDELISLHLEFTWQNLKDIEKEESYKDIKGYSNLTKFIWQYSKGENKFTTGDRNRCYLNFKNNFFEIICNKHIENWVDIENVYYGILKECVFGKPKGYGYIGDIRKLNSDFEQVKNLLEKYLDDRVVKSYDYSKESLKIDRILDFLKLRYRDLKNDSESEFLLEFSKDDHKDLIFLDEEYRNLTFGSSKNTNSKLCFLNFNYTATIDHYIKSISLHKYSDYGDINQIQIHGKLNEKINSINFGFGDEMDDDYKAIERINDNAYLKNFKSFQYLQNSNYKHLLDLVDSDKFQVYIMGHSCGLSDRTLLNTIFEHENCRSIKVFYYEEENENGKKDNYTEIIQNISRHFNKKKLMREKIVNKTLCRPLPQVQLPRKNKIPPSSE